MSEPIGNRLVDSLVELISSALNESIGDYIDHSQADRLRKAIAEHEIVHFKREDCEYCQKEHYAERTRPESPAIER